MKDTTSLRFMLLLGLPSFGLTFGVSILTAYLPTILHELVSPILIGLIIGAEGFFGLFLPPIFGVLSDRSKTVTGRWKYLVPATSAMAAGLVLMGLFNNIWVIGSMVALFYIGYFAYLAPYWATYPDLIPHEYSGRSRSAESSWRVVGAFSALVSGGFLLSVWRPLPFVLSAGLIVTVTTVFSYLMLKRRKVRIKKNGDSFRTAIGDVLSTLRQGSDIRNLLIANSFWNATLQSIQAFTVLFFTQGLGRSQHFVSGLIFPIAAIGVLIMAPLSGKLADKVGHYKVLLVSCLIYGLGNFVPAFTQKSWVIFIIPVISGAAASIMTLSYSSLMRLMGREEHGALSGVFGISRGLGTFLGPLLVGIAIDFGKNIFKSTNGYGAFWFVAGLFILCSIPFLISIRNRGFRQPI